MFCKFVGLVLLVAGFCSAAVAQAQAVDAEGISGGSMRCSMRFIRGVLWTATTTALAI